MKHEPQLWRLNIPGGKVLYGVTCPCGHVIPATMKKRQAEAAVKQHRKEVA